ncbi:MAG: hypothetical protein QF570_10000 [Myxococcota bacterium]|jgi:cytochrome P450|nr:hypothetical protein [Myxococcota bacterium]
MVTNKRAARRAIAELDETLGEIITTREREGLDPNDLFARICASWNDVEGEARNIVLIHMGSMSNLFAALAWTLVHILERPEIQERVRTDSELLDRATYESIRLRQRSIVLCQVLRPTELCDEKTAYLAGPGVFLTTMMPVMNTTALPDLDGFDPEHFRLTRKFSDPQPLRRQIGGVARADRSCRVIYRLR